MNYWAMNWSIILHLPRCSLVAIVGKGEIRITRMKLCRVGTSRECYSRCGFNPQRTHWCRRIKNSCDCSTWRKNSMCADRCQTAACEPTTSDGTQWRRNESYQSTQASSYEIAVTSYIAVERIYFSSSTYVVDVSRSLGGGVGRRIQVGRIYN